MGRKPVNVKCQHSFLPFSSVSIAWGQVDFWSESLSRPVKVTRVFSASNSRLGAVQAQSTHCTRVMRKISNGLCAKFCRLSVIQFKCTHLSSTCITATNLLSYKNIAQGNLKKSPHAQICLSKGLIDELIEVDLS